MAARGAGASSSRDLDGDFIGGLVHVSPYCFQLSDATFEALLALLQLAVRETQQRLQAPWQRVAAGVPSPSSLFMSADFTTAAGATSSSSQPDSKLDSESDKEEWRARWLKETSLWGFVLSACLQLFVSHLQAISLVVDVVDPPFGSEGAPTRAIPQASAYRSLLLSLALEFPGHCVDKKRLLFR